MPLLNDANGTVTIVVHEDELGMRKYGSQIPCSAALIAERIDDVLVVCLVMRFGTTHDATFEVYINVHGSDGLGTEMLRRLAAQEQFQVSFHVRSIEPVRQIGFTNRMRRQFQDILKRAEEVPTWNMRQFDAAKAEFQARHPLDEIGRLLSTPTIPTFSPGERLSGNKQVHVVTNGVVRNRVPSEMVKSVTEVLIQQMIGGYRLAFPVLADGGEAIRLVALAALANDPRLRVVPEANPAPSDEIVVVLFGFQREGAFLRKAEIIKQLYPEQPDAPEFTLA
jgi:hypothetical protein